MEELGSQCNVASELALNFASSMACITIDYKQRKFALTPLSASHLSWVMLPSTVELLMYHPFYLE